MKKLFLILLITIELSLIKIPTYVELNNLAIIEEIAIEQKDNQYTIILKEIIPIKANEGINYKYKYYKETSLTIKKAYNIISSKTKKKLYLNKTKSLITNISSSKDIINTLNISPKTIIHTKNIYEEIKYSKNQS